MSSLLTTAANFNFALSQVLPASLFPYRCRLLTGTCPSPVLAINHSASTQSWITASVGTVGNAVVCALMRHGTSLATTSTCLGPISFRFFFFLFNPFFLHDTDGT